MLLCNFICTTILLIFNVGEFQQNGVGERCNRTLVDMVRELFYFAIGIVDGGVKNRS
jgi:hypothetical protein